MHQPLRLASAFVLALSLVAAPAFAKSRIKDIVEFEGVRENMLVGYGIVVGLNGTGDALRNAPMTKQSLEAMLERLGVNTRDATLNTKNVAAVMVTARLPAFAAAGVPTTAKAARTSALERAGRPSKSMWPRASLPPMLTTMCVASGGRAET